MKPLNVAVIGVGHMGINHVKAYKKRTDVNLVGLVDPHLKQGQGLAEEYNCRVLSLDELPGLVDAVSIVSPSNTHAKIGATMLSKGIHCLIEKPLAMTMDQSRALVDIAQKNKCVLLVGHIEEYNTGFQYLRECLEKNGEAPLFISAERFNFGSDRIQDADVVLDLMIHDLGCVLDLLGVNVRFLEILSAHGSGLKPSMFDTAVAVLRTKNCMITLQANRKSHLRHREFILHTQNFSYFLNFISQQVSVYRNNQLMSQTNHPWLPPLEHEISHFIECARNPEKQPLTSGMKASVTMKYVEAIQKRIYQS